MTAPTHDKTVFSLLGSMTDPAFIIDPDGTLLYANAAFAEKLEQPPSVIGNPNIFELQSSGRQVTEIPARLRKQVDRAVSSCHQVEFAVQHRGRRLHYIVTPEYSPWGDITRLYVIVRETACSTRNHMHSFRDRAKERGHTRRPID
ncbi:MAG: PAS domain-containing protein [Chlorobiaceae bacterium]|nr:PAS domain-containing protein [Chlorobiaceae bacterium]